MVTAEGQKSRVVEAIKYGVDNYVVKPFSVEQITKKLKMVISKIAFI
jgi:two-component system chemotaxis response regulator CheY